MMEKFFIERITDVSNDLCNYIDTTPNLPENELINLYDYHKDNQNIYPLTNWHAHRLRCLSSIAVKLKNKVKIWDCHYHILQYFFERSRCSCHCNDDTHLGVNHDFFHRDSLNYLIYGSQALANACLYLKPHTHYNYYLDLFIPILDFLDPYLKGRKTHIEYVHSEIHSDQTKPELGKEWSPNYASTFLRIIDKLKN